MPDRERRLVRSGDRFTSDELRDGLVELELPVPTPEPPEHDQTEPWGSMKRHLRRSRRLREYHELLDGLGYDRENDRGD